MDNIVTTSLRGRRLGRTEDEKEKDEEDRERRALPSLI